MSNLREAAQIGTTCLIIFILGMIAGVKMERETTLHKQMVKTLNESGETCARLFNVATTRSDSLLIMLARNDCTEK